MDFRPSLQSGSIDGVRLLIDANARERGVLVAFSDRIGGASAAPFESLNLALRVGDDERAVRENRRRFAHAAGFSAQRLVLARQVHGTKVIDVDEHDTGVVGEGDGLKTGAAGPVLGMLTADCAPVVVAGARGVCVLHGGWRGLAAGIIEEGVAAVEPAWAAWVGPCIHACCYEVGREVTDAFRSAGLPVVDDSHVDCGRAATFALHRAGVQRVAASIDCTHCHDNYFSYRRDGVTGRQGGIVALLDHT